MKHTYWYIDKIIELLNDFISRFELKSESEKSKAIIKLDLLKEYDQKLRKLIDSHKTTQHLEILHNCHIDTIPDWASRVNEQFRKLDALLDVLEQDLPILKRTIESEPDMWGSRIRDMHLGLMQSGFDAFEHNMEEFRTASIFERKHLEEILDDLKDIEDLLE